MSRRFYQSRLSEFGWISAREARDAELFYRELIGAPASAVISALRTLPRSIPTINSDLIWSGTWEQGVRPWSEYNEGDGLPDNDEESSSDFASKFVEPDSSPNGANAPFAPLLMGTGYWPIITSDPHGRAVSYRTSSGSWTGQRERSFGADRSSGGRYHVGVDLYGRFGDEVVAIEDGRIVAFYGFCCGENKTSWALLVQHSNVVVNYGEVVPDSLTVNRLAVGSTVRAGQVIGRVGRNPGGSSMIHFETYNLGTTRNYSWLKGQPRPALLLNPTRLLLRLQEQGLPHAIGSGSGVTTAQSTTPSWPNTGKGTFRHALLDAISGQHRGDNVAARWNIKAATARAEMTVDIVVYLHGYGTPRRDFLARKAEAAGLDMMDASGAVTVRVDRPTLALVPMGIHSPSLRRADRWVFSNLATTAEFDALVTAGLEWLASSVFRLGTGALNRGRVTLMAHSGGGAAMNQLLSAGLDPDEMICYDSTYGASDPILHWARAKITGSSATSGALRVFYRHGGTERTALSIKQAIDRTLPAQTNCAALTGRYRVDRTTEGHNDIPHTYSSVLLNNIAATLPSMLGQPTPCTTGSTMTP